MNERAVATDKFPNATGVESESLGLDGAGQVSIRECEPNGGDSARKEQPKELCVHGARKDSGDLFNCFGRSDADAFTTFGVQADAFELAIDGFATAVHNDQSTRMQLVHASEGVKHLWELRGIIEQCAPKFDHQWCGAHQDITSLASACARRAMPRAVVSSKPNRRFRH
jgi:hypothetical protein